MKKVSQDQYIFALCRLYKDHKIDLWLDEGKLMIIKVKKNERN